jgi:hypothetical protein
MAITLNYLNVGSGSTPPTAAQAYAVNSINVTLSPANSADISQAITHNFGLATADISAGWPAYELNPLDTLAIASGWYFQSQNPNFMVMGRYATTAGLETVAGNPQVLLTIQRPNTLIR